MSGAGECAVCFLRPVTDAVWYTTDGGLVGFCHDHDLKFRHRPISEHHLSAKQWADRQGGPAAAEPILAVSDRRAAEAINHPAHYTAHPSGVECIQIVEHLTFNVGCAVKYLWRQGLKPGPESAGDLKAAALADLKKAAWYVAREIERIERT